MARSRPQHTVITAKDGSLSAQQLLDAVNSFAFTLVNHDVQVGSVVGLVGPADLNWVVAYHAISWIGAVVAPLPYTIPATTNAELERALNTLQPEFIIATQSCDSVLLKSLASLNIIPTHAQGNSDRIAERFWPLNEPRLCILTSGTTTGKPQSITLSTSQLLFSAFGSATRLGLLPNDSWLACLPLWHVGGSAIIWRSAFYGTHVHLLPKFDATTINKHIDSGKINLISLVPIMLERILDARNDTVFPSSLRAILIGGSATNQSLRLRCQAINAPISISWGMSETASQVATAFPGVIPDTDSVGPVLPFASIHLDKDEVLTVAGPLAPNGNFITHDIGAIESNGNIQIKGRIDDVIITGGKKIIAKEVEQVLCQHEAVANAAVVGIYNASWGETPAAFLVSSDDKKRPNDSELMEFCAKALPNYAIPRHFFWRQIIEQTSLGKIARGALRSEAALLIKDANDRSQ
ncbi:MAG: AMP-binding protein [Deltaproteobacteria bacterium]|nr:AMP-binding protein [Deltaproteobacteria bacterium]